MNENPKGFQSDTPLSDSVKARLLVDFPSQIESAVVNHLSSETGKKIKINSMKVINPVTAVETRVEDSINYIPEYLDTLSYVAKVEIELNIGDSIKKEKWNVQLDSNYQVVWSIEENIN